MILAVNNEAGVVISVKEHLGIVEVKTFTREIVYFSINEIKIAPSLEKIYHYKLSDPIYGDNIYIILN